MASVGRMVSAPRPSAPLALPLLFPSPILRQGTSTPSTSSTSSTTSSSRSTLPWLPHRFARTYRHVTPSAAGSCPRAKGHCLAKAQRSPSSCVMHNPSRRTLTLNARYALLHDPPLPFRPYAPVVFSLKPHWQPFCHSISTAKWPPDLPLSVTSTQF